VTAEFGAPALLQGVNTDASERQPIVSRDGLRLSPISGRTAPATYASSRSSTRPAIDAWPVDSGDGGSTGLDLYQTTRGQ